MTNIPPRLLLTGLTWRWPRVPYAGSGYGSLQGRCQAKRAVRGAGAPGMLTAAANRLCDVARTDAEEAPARWRDGLG